MDILQGEDCLILPMLSAFGLFPKSGSLYKLIQYFGEELANKIENHIIKKYLGEQPVGSAFLIRNPLKKSSYRFIMVVSLFRALTTATDEMSLVDPQHVPKDYAYNALRGCLLTLLRHNAVSDKNRIRTVYCPDFFEIRKEGPGGDKLTLNDLDETVRQMFIAVKGVIDPCKNPRDWGQALLLTTQIIKAPDITQDLTPLIESGALETRGLYSTAELDQVMSVVFDHKNRERQESAMRVLAACLHRTDNVFCIPKQEVAHRIIGQKGGCLALLLDMVIHRKIFVHTEISPEELTIGELIGQGTGGVVYRGIWKDKRVAIKQFNKDIPYEDFIKELSIMCIVQHPNLVKCYGGVTQKKLIVEELLQVNLNQVLSAKNVSIDYGIIAEIAISAAGGIDYLHNHCNLIHRDLKSMNLLINTHKTHLDVKVCDFAFSRIINKKEHMTGNIGTVSWMAPEVLEKKKYNEKADVYSFGIILWELVSRELPYSNTQSFAIIMDVIKGKRLAIPRDCPTELKRLINACWSPKPKHRPSMTNIIQALRKFHKSLPLSEKAQVTLNVTNIIVSGPETKRNLPDRNYEPLRILPRNSMASELKPRILDFDNSQDSDSVGES